MDYSTLWTVSSLLSQASEQIAIFIKTAEGEPQKQDDVVLCEHHAPSEAHTADRMEAYRLALLACEDARYVLRETADREGHAVTKVHARKCNVIAQRCTRAIDALGKAGEL